MTARPAIDRVIDVARSVRADLLDRPSLPRDLAGQCGLASMLVAAALDDPRLLRVGFYMKHETLYGRRGRYPNKHAWCQLGETLVDVTATQFGRNRAIHVAIASDDDRYVETADSADAVNDIMTNWRGRELPEYARLARRLRRRRS